MIDLSGGFGTQLPAEAKISCWEAIRCAGVPLDVAGTGGALTRALSAAALKCDDVAVYDPTVDRLLASRFGSTDDRLRRAALACLTLRLKTSTPLEPVLVQAQRARAMKRLCSGLTGAAALGAGDFTKDVAFAAGLALPAGAMTLFLPPSGIVKAAPLRARRMAGQVARIVSDQNILAGVRWAAQIGGSGWMAMHLDPRWTDEFNAQGLANTFSIAGHLLAPRSDLAGLHCASWFFDPQIANLTPRLAFLGRTALENGALCLPLRTSPEQIELALRRSPTRRQAFSQGRYRPRCYGLYWPRTSLLAWAEKCGDAQADDQLPIAS